MRYANNAAYHYEVFDGLTGADYNVHRLSRRCAWVTIFAGGFPWPIEIQFSQDGETFGDTITFVTNRDGQLFPVACLAFRIRAVVLPLGLTGYWGEAYL